MIIYMEVCRLQQRMKKIITPTVAIANLFPTIDQISSSFAISFFSSQREDLSESFIRISPQNYYITDFLQRGHLSICIFFFIFSQFSAISSEGNNLDNFYVYPASSYYSILSDYKKFIE